jgi:hypothetical protein
MLEIVVNTPPHLLNSEFILLECGGGRDAPGVFASIFFSIIHGTDSIFDTIEIPGQTKLCWAYQS